MVEQRDIEEGFWEDANVQGGNYQKDPETYKECVLRAIEKCRLEMSKELTKGKTIFMKKDNVTIPIVIPDQRKVVEGCVNCLYDLLLFTFDDEGRVKLDKLIEDIEGLQQKYLDEYIRLETFVPNKLHATRNKQIPTESALGNYMIQQKEDERVQLYRKMFQELLLLYKRKRELSNRVTASSISPLSPEAITKDPYGVE